ncbi:MAG: ankyrin repeat domain-containing protein [Acidobacteria bacterium]|nr:ankyrin repeat domain-containing protein [Acidobacteriota bacterium]MCA1651219.1 ankyrin repeat domain-containing protein [Acidobacteriota bacterium]
MDRQAELISAIKAGDSIVVQQLLTDNKELVRGRTATGASLLMFSIYARHPELVDLFLQHGATLDIHEAAAAGRLPALEAILTGSPSPVNEYSADGFPPLGLAAFFGHEQAVRLLLDRGADVNAVAHNSQRVAPLHAAVAGPTPDIVEILLEAGAEPNARQESEYTALHVAASKGLDRIVRVLLAHGASKTAVNTTGLTPYELAKQKGHHAMAESLLQPQGTDMH